MREATNLMIKQAAQLFPETESEQGSFLNALLKSSKGKQPAVIWLKDEFRDSHDLRLLDDSRKPSWLPEAVSFLEPDSVPGKSVLFDKGAIYPVDVSSIITASAMLEVTDARRVLDVCAAPGGKTLFASVILKPDFLLSNEVVGKRLGILRHNLRKSGRPNLYTQNLKPLELSEPGDQVFDLVIVDAPCSGQSLLAKGIKNPGCFHPNIIKGNAKRQFKILSQSATCVGPGGFLFYSTCTFARRENEGVIEKFLNHHGEFTPLEVPHLSEYRSEQSDFASYRIYPHRHTGAGGYACLMKRAGERTASCELPAVFLEYPVH